MANRYVTINGKRYRTARRTFTNRQSQARQINVTLGGAVATQDFGFTGQRWRMAILVELTPEDSAYGSKANLETAYQTTPVNFVDSFGVDQGNVIFEDDLELPPAYALVDATVPFEVEISLRKVS